MSNPAALILCNEALIALGEAPLDDLEGDSAAHTVARLRYQSVVDTLLGSHPWLFNRALVRLAQVALGTVEAAGFTAGYRLPDPCFRIVCPLINGRPAEVWGVAAGLLYVDAGPLDAVTLEYHTRADEALWRPGFRQAVIYRLAAEFCVPVSDDTARAKMLFDQAERELSRARHLNATEHPAIRLGNVGRGRVMRSRQG